VQPLQKKFTIRFFKKNINLNSVNTDKRTFLNFLAKLIGGLLAGADLFIISVLFEKEKN
jgi:hypothetical protein